MNREQDKGKSKKVEHTKNSKKKKENIKIVNSLNILEVKSIITQV